MKSRFVVHETPLSDLKLIQRILFEDDRGYLERLFCADELAAVFFRKPIAQINHTLTKKRNTVRGMHFQHTPGSELKMISCVRGRVYDVAVDLRKYSKTFLHWHAEILSEDNRKSLIIPEGFAHGFQSLSDNCQLIYLHSNFYNPALEAVVNPIDKKLSISWPEEISFISERDKNSPMLNDKFKGIEL